MKARRWKGCRRDLAALAAGAIIALAPVWKVAADGNRNACGCYRSESGSCYCDKKAKCGCPGECEPKGCEEKREKEIEKEIQSETKRAEESARRQGGQVAPAETPAKKPPPPPSARKLTAKQLAELNHLLKLYVESHPEAAGKTTEALLRELGEGR